MESPNNEKPEVPVFDDIPADGGVVSTTLDEKLFTML
jgi:hypothetical protein